MEDEKGALNEFLEGLENPDSNESPFEEAGHEPEQKKEEEVPVRFDKDPNVQKYIERQIEKRLKDFKPEIPPVVKEENNPLVDAFATIVGTDTPDKTNALKVLKQSLEDYKNQAAEEAYNRFIKASQEQAQEENRLVEELQTGFEEIEQTYNVDLSSKSPIAMKTRNEFIDFVKKIASKDSDGDIIEYPDLTQAFEVFKEYRKPIANNSQAKYLASRGMSKSAEAPKGVQERITFDNIDKFLGL